jgi:hypothetical protein
MPPLRDTELRLLLVLLRQTVGWNQDGKPVILPYKALIRRTGRQSEAIARALESLARRELIHMPRAKLPKRLRKTNSNASQGEEQQ